MKPLAIYFDRNCINISKLAREAGLPAQTLYQYTSGRGSVMNMGIGSFIKLAHALGLTADEFAAELEAIAKEQRVEYHLVEIDGDEK